MVKRKLTDKDIEVIKYLYEKGVYVKDIAKIFGVNIKTIRHHLRKLGVEPRIKPTTPELVDKIIHLYRQGYTLRQISRMLGISYDRTRKLFKKHYGSPVKGIYRKRKTKLKKNIDTVIKYLKDNGPTPIEKVSEKTGISPSTLKKYPLIAPEKLRIIHIQTLKTRPTKYNREYKRKLKILEKYRLLTLPDDERIPRVITEIITRHNLIPRNKLEKSALTKTLRTTLRPEEIEKIKQILFKNKDT